MKMGEKQKHQHTLPNRQLAKIYGFSAADLSANQAGFMSLAQEWRIPLWARTSINWATQSRLMKLFSDKIRRRAEHLCGKIILEYQLHEVHGGRFQMNSYTLVVESYPQRFVITAEQYRVLSDAVHYHVYYDAEMGQILSLKRAMNNCNDTEQ